MAAARASDRGAADAHVQGMGHACKRSHTLGLVHAKGTEGEKGQSRARPAHTRCALAANRI